MTNAVEMGSDTNLGIPMALISLKSSITLVAPHRNGDQSHGQHHDPQP